MLAGCDHTYWINPRWLERPMNRDELRFVGRFQFVLVCARRQQSLPDP